MTIRGGEARPFSWAAVVPFMERDGLVAEELGRRAAAPRDGLSRSACRQRVERWKRLGLTIDEADRVAVALGEHAWDVWGEAWWALPPLDLDVVFAGLRARRRRLEVERRGTLRRRAQVVAGYTAVERARERGPHVCAPEGCCGARNAARNDMRGIAA